MADVAQDQFDLVELRANLGARPGYAEDLDDHARATGAELERIMALADASQCTRDSIACAHHVVNVTYNVMRGGAPLSGYWFDTDDFVAFVEIRNRSVAERHARWLDGLPDSIERRDLLQRIDAIGDVHLVRLGREYLPISFSRRHGDPSRPWNSFFVRTRDDEGRRAMYYEGNWRDVFQNWEALCASFPEYFPGLVAMFVNASTADGHNPYRITRDGIDWEVPEPDDPWGNIGYWGDHQLIYLLRLLEASDRFMPGAVQSMLDERCFTYADVPYRIAAYEDLVQDPKATITFDGKANARSAERVASLGGDGKLLRGHDDQLVVVSLVEKLLVASLAKLANFVPGGGIWMNTQRPEWNDANNALAGYGLSMVTLHHLRQFLDYFRRIVGDLSQTTVSAEVATWLERVSTILKTTPVDGASESDDRQRKSTMDQLGHAASNYRKALYDTGFSGAATSVSGADIVELCDQAIEHLDATIHDSGGENGLVHSYNLVAFSADGKSASVMHLPEMLEGQVATLTSGVMDHGEQTELLDALFTSDLYRPDQGSFLLARVQELPGFVDKNIVMATDIEANELLEATTAKGERSIVGSDADGDYRFHPEIVDEGALNLVLDRLALKQGWGAIVQRNRQATLDIYEHVFGHRSFIGRSGAMYAYEGIGSIYWHMIGKLLVATQEAATAAVAGGASDEVAANMVAAYERVRSGLGFTKTAAEFGAIPIDPYSHTPAHAGAQQPGMTGVVKESILARPLELGVRFDDGQVVFDPVVFRRSELLDAAQEWTVTTVSGQPLVVELEAQTLGLTVCQVPVIVGFGQGDASVTIEFNDGRSILQDELRLDRDVSAMVFGHTGEIKTIRAMFEPSATETAQVRP